MSFILYILSLLFVFFPRYVFALITNTDSKKILLHSLQFHPNKNIRETYALRLRQHEMIRAHHLQNSSYLSS